LEEIGAIATKEYTLERALEKMKTEWEELNFTFVPYRDSVSFLSLSASVDVIKYMQRGHAKTVL